MLLKTKIKEEIGNDEHRDYRGRQNHRDHDDFDRDRDHKVSSEYRDRKGDDRFRRHRNDRYNDRDGRYDEDRRRKNDDNNDPRRYRRYHERSDSGYRSDDYDDSRRSRREDDRDSFHRRRRQRSRDFTSSDDDDNDYYHYDENHRKETGKEKKPPKEKKEWPPSFQKDGDAFCFDTRSAMFYEPLSDFFYDPKSKLYYGNKKSAYFRYDEKEDPPFVEVQKMEKVGDAGENIAIDLSAPKAAPSKPKIAIKLSTKTVKSSKSTLAAQKADKQQHQQPATVSKAKQQQIANIGKWNEKQAELKEEAAPPPQASLPQKNSKIRTTPKGEPICMICKKKFPNLARLRLHEKASDLHKKNVLALEEKRKNNNAAKRKAAETQQHQQQPYTDRAEKRRQLHGTDLGASESLSRLQQDSKPQDAPDSQETTLDLFHEHNVGHKMLQKMGYGPNDENTSDMPKTANEHLRKEWDRIEAMAQKSSRNRYS